MTLTAESVPKISVLLPVYNAERYIRPAVESVLGQTFDDFELIALDDGSTDRSLLILRGFEARDSRMHVFARENRGLVATRNELITIARGTYLAVMDSDDVCRPRRFEEQVNYLVSRPECVAVGSKVLFIDPEGMPLCEFIKDLTHEEIDSGHMSGGFSMRMSHPSVMLRKEALLQVGGYREGYPLAEDLDLFLRLAEIGRLANLPAILLEYRQHFGSICHSHHEELSRFIKKAVQEAWRRRGLMDPDILEPAWKHETSAETHRKWAWWALSAGNLAPARTHAIKAFVREPFSIESLKAVACSIRGY